ncbi:MAG: hypothetical protein IJ458_01560 [Clostridia bacterium]|nr:hypothetical protein [Clostridia bacterium]
MTKEQFEAEMLKWVTFYKEKLEQTDLRCAKLPEGFVSKPSKLTYNPFLEFDPKYFNIRILSNLEGLNMVIYQHPELKPHEISLFIICNPKFKVLNQMLNHNSYLVNELKEKTHSPMDIAISYARWEQLNARYKHLPKR